MRYIQLVKKQMTKVMLNLLIHPHRIPRATVSVLFFQQYGVLTHDYTSFQRIFQYITYDDERIKHSHHGVQITQSLSCGFRRLLALNCRQLINIKDLYYIPWSSPNIVSLFFVTRERSPKPYPTHHSRCQT